MMPTKSELQNFRHRGFKDANGVIVMVFGDEPAPLNADGSLMLKLWDHDVKQVITVSDHLE